MKKTMVFMLAVLLCLSLFAGCTAVGTGATDATESTVTETAAAEAVATEAPAAEAVAEEIVNEPSIHWRKDTTGKYMDDDSVQSLICVQAMEGTTARVLLFEKTTENGKTVWTQTLECDAYIGLNGLGKTKEGDSKTPTGDFGIIEAFGIKENPGTSLPYVDVTEDIYCCGDETAYNQIIDINDYPHDCADGEHLIDYTPEYNYGFFLDYNAEGTLGLGSAIFFHCKGANTYTGGCIAVDEADMIQILQSVDANTRVIIDYMPSGGY